MSEGGGTQAVNPSGIAVVRYPKVLCFFKYEEAACV